MNNQSYVGNYSLALDYSLRPEKQWIGETNTEWVCLVFAVLEPGKLRLFDLSDISEIHFVMKSNVTASEIEFNIFVNDANTQYTKKIIVSTPWLSDSVVLADLRPIFCSQLPHPNLKSIYSFGFTVKASDGIRSGRILIDKVMFVHQNGKITIFDDFERETLNPKELLEINGVKGQWIIDNGTIKQ
jgi:hypothetical protein